MKHSALALAGSLCFSSFACTTVNQYHGTSTGSSSDQGGASSSAGGGSSSSATASGVSSSSSSASVSGGASSSSSGQGSGGASGQAFSFVVVGCNRVEKADITQGNPSTANLEQLTRTFADVAALAPLPRYFFFAGDMVYGYKDASVLAPELQAWIALYEASPLPALGVELVAIPGNHEMQSKKNGVKLAYPDAETTWVSVMAPYIKGANGPHAGGLDMLQTDQSKLTYSFDFGDTHFVILNTDPVGADWQVPVKWISSDLIAAHAAGAKHIFAIGHKPAYPSPLSGEGGLSMFPTIRDAFWSAMENSRADAMLAAHNHLWYKENPDPGKTWQIVAGNGGSLLEPGVIDADAYYGFTTVDVDANGTVTVKSHGRDVPSAGYMAPAAAYPTTVRETVDVTWKAP